MRWLLVLLAVLTLALQFQLWSGEGGLPEVWRLERAVEEQRAENRELAERNRALAAEVEDLRRGLDAIEERARSELGMIHEDETFFLVVDDDD
ncbi:MAG: cell division protein FtsB [Pseudomonadota bacterium]